MPRPLTQIAIVCYQLKNGVLIPLVTFANNEPKNSGKNTMILESFREWLQTSKPPATNSLVRIEIDSDSLELELFSSLIREIADRSLPVEIHFNR